MSTEIPRSNDGSNLSLSGQLRKAQKLMTGGSNNTEPAQDGQIRSRTHEPLVEALTIFETLQEQIQRASIFSANESLSDIQTSSLPLISVEYHMAKACLQLRTISSTSRHSNVKKGIELLHLFLNRSDSFEGILESSAQQQYQHFLEQSEETEEASTGSSHRTPLSSSRDEKIARYKRCKEIKQQIARMNAQLSQRNRLDLEDHEDLDV